MLHKFIILVGIIYLARITKTEKPVRYIIYRIHSIPNQTFQNGGFVISSGDCIRFPTVLGGFKTFIHVLIFLIIINFTRPFITAFCKVVRRTTKVASWAVWVDPKERFAFKRMMSF